MTEPEREALFGRLADDYLDRLQRGETPNSSEYVAAHPAVADLIRDGFPLLSVLRPPAPAPAMPAQLGEFRLIRPIGRGGMGVVYEAVQEPLGRRVAVKVLVGPAAADAVAVERFRREARTAAGLHHTNIVPVFAVGDAAGTPFYAMQFIDGRPLGWPAEAALVATPSVAGGSTDRSAPPRISVLLGSYKDTARLGLQAAEALAYAHGQGVLHRDVKPSNMLLDHRGTVWLTDFGLAKAADVPDLTASGDLVGTLRYMAPERFRGLCDARSDIYALGASLYELLSGRPLFDGAGGAELVERVTTGHLKTLRRIAPLVPRDLDVVVGKAMALEPADRYATAMDFADDLRLFLTDLPVRARRHSWHEQLWRFARRRPTVAGLTAALVLVILSLAAVGWGSAYYQRRAERETKDRLLQSQIAQARASIRSGQPGQRFDTLATIADAARLARELKAPPETILELRDLAASALALPDARQTRTWNGWAPGTAALVISPRGDLFARSDWKGNITVRRIDSAEEVRAIPGSGSVAFDLRFSLDAHFLAAQYVGKTDLHVWAIAEFGADRTFPIDGTADFSPDGTMIAVPNRSPPTPEVVPKKTFPAASRLAVPAANSPILLSRPDGILVYDLQTGVIRYRLPAAGGPNRCAFHPTGQRLAVLAQGLMVSQACLAVHDLAGRAPPRVIMSFSDIQSVAWDRPGDRLAAVGRVVSVRDPDNAFAFTEMPGPGSPVGEAVFTPDGLLVGSEAGSFRVWDPPTRGVVLTLPGQLVRVGGITNDSQVIAFRGGAELGMWEVTRSSVCRPIGRSYLNEGNEVRDLDWSPDDRALAFATPRAAVVYDLRTNKEMAWLELPTPVGAESVHWCSASELMTAGPTGIWRRSLNLTPGSPLLEGTRRNVFSEPVYGMGWSADGKRTAIPVGVGARRMLVLDQEVDESRALVGEFSLLGRAALSPDGRWCAGATTGDGLVSHRVIVWDATGGSVVRRFTADEVPASGRVAFSTDGKWLVTAAGDEYRFWSTETWAAGLRLAVPPAAVAGPLAFDRQGTMLAVAWGSFGVRLFQPDGGAVLVTLAAPGQADLTSLAFSHSSDRLAVGCASGVTYVWDLSRLHAELSSLGLGWE